MTNRLASAVLTNLPITVGLITTLATNWTGYYHQNREAGIVVTNYTAQVTFESKTTPLLLKTVHSSTVVWGEPVKFLVSTNMTNFVIPLGHGGIWITNIGVK